jgi:hypothetical protein
MGLKLGSKLIFGGKGFFQPINRCPNSLKSVLWLRAAKKFSLQITTSYFGVYKPFFAYWVDVGA